MAVRLLHGSLYVGAFLCHIHVLPPSAACCPHTACAVGEAATPLDDLLHAFMTCPAVAPAVDWVCRVFAAASGAPQPPTCPRVFLGDEASVWAPEPGLRFLWARSGCRKVRHCWYVAAAPCTSRWPSQPARAGPCMDMSLLQTHTSPSPQKCPRHGERAGASGPCSHEQCSAGGAAFGADPTRQGGALKPSPCQSPCRPLDASTVSLWSPACTCRTAVRQAWGSTGGKGKKAPDGGGAGSTMQYAQT